MQKAGGRNRKEKKGDEPHLFSEKRGKKKPPPDTKGNSVNVKKGISSIFKGNQKKKRRGREECSSFFTHRGRKKSLEGNI